MSLGLAIGRKTKSVLSKPNGHGLRGYWSYLRDSLINVITGLGTQKDPRSGAFFALNVLDRNVLENMYRGDWLARAIVDIPADDATREWRKWQAPAAAVEKIERLERDLFLQQKLRLALIRARLYGGGALIIGVDDGVDPMEELDYDSLGVGSLKFVVVVNRYELSAGPRIYNVSSPWYTRPQYYMVSTPVFGFEGEPGLDAPMSPPLLADPNMRNTPNYGMVRLHPSRVVEFAGNELPDWRLAPMGGGWGDSVLQTVDDALTDFASIIGGLAGLISDMKVDVVKVPELSRKLSTDELSQKVLQRFSVANQAKSTINTLLLDKEEEWSRIQTAFGSTPQLIQVAMTVACAAGRIPETRIMGNSPNKGLAAAGASGGEVDIRNYYDGISSDQKTKNKPLLRPLDICIKRSALGNDDPKVDYSWNPLYQDTPAEVADRQLKKSQTTQIYVSLGLINEDAMREAVVNQLNADEVYPGLDAAVAKFGIKPEEPAPPPAQALPTPPPGMMNRGQFEANPFHMLRAQAAAKSGMPIRVPPHAPSAPPLPAPSKDGLDDAFDPSRHPRGGKGHGKASGEFVSEAGGDITVSQESRTGKKGEASPHTWKSGGVDALYVDEKSEDADKDADHLVTAASPPHKLPHAAQTAALHYRRDGEAINAMLRSPKQDKDFYEMTKLYAGPKVSAEMRQRNVAANADDTRRRARAAQFKKEYQRQLSQVKPLVDYLHTAEIERPIVVYRGMRGKGWAGVLGKMQPGAIMQDNGIMSTTPKHDVATYFGGQGGQFAGTTAKGSVKGGVTMEIRVPQGAHGADISGSQKGGYHYQHEIVFEPGTQLRLVSYNQAKGSAVFEMVVGKHARPRQPKR